MKLRQQTAAVPKTRCAKTGGLDRSTNRDKVKFKYSTKPDKAKPAERQGQKAPGLRASKMADLPKDVTSFSFEDRARVSSAGQRLEALTLKGRQPFPVALHPTFSIEYRIDFFRS